MYFRRLGSRVRDMLPLQHGGHGGARLGGKPRSSVLAHLGLDPGDGVPPDLLFHRCIGCGWDGRKLVRCACRRLRQVRRIDHLVHQSTGQCGAGADRLAAHHQAAQVVGGQHGTGNLHRTHGKVDADADFGQTKTGTRRGNPVIRRQHEKEAAGNGGPAGDDNHRLGAGKEAQKSHVQPLDNAGLIVFVKVAGHLQIKACREHAKGALDNDGTHVRVLFCRADHLGQTHQTIRTQCVDRRRVQHQMPHMAVILNPDPACVGHDAPLVVHSHDTRPTALAKPKRPRVRRVDTEAPILALHWTRAGRRHNGPRRDDAQHNLDPGDLHGWPSAKDRIKPLMNAQQEARR
mmetsp:Transcript_22697/g.37363  ORF Transcript_22697/g.37363 Transcript_22697/m.37363 type:complete len:346 (-) Transcript_22697:4158-5195(-)